MTTYPKPTSVEERLTLKSRFPEDEDCVLCLQSMKGALVIRLPCGHRYHEKCHARLRDAAASYRYRCPSCRSDVKTQIQRLKMYELWGDDIWDQYNSCSHRLDCDAPLLDRPSGLHKMEVFRRWILEGLSEEELFELSNTQRVHSLQDPEVPVGSPVSSEDLSDYLNETVDLDVSADNSDDYVEQYLASLVLSDEDESQPDSP